MKMTKSKIKPKPTNDPKPIDPLQHIHAFCHFVMKKKNPTVQQSVRACACRRLQFLTRIQKSEDENITLSFVQTNRM